MLVAASQVGTLLARPRQGSDSRGGKDKLWLQDRASTQPQSQAPAIATFLSDVCAMTEIELHKNWFRQGRELVTGSKLEAHIRNPQHGAHTFGHGKTSVMQASKMHVAIEG